MGLMGVALDPLDNGAVHRKSTRWFQTSFEPGSKLGGFRVVLNQVLN